MERNRTLGTSFTGQELLSHELLRALSLLRRGPKELVNELFKEAPQSRRKRGQAEKRDYSPIPVQSMHDGGILHVQLHRFVPDRFVGKIIGENGNNINHLKAANHLEDVWIDKLTEEKKVILKGEPTNVANAWAMVEEIMAAGHFVNPPGVVHARGRAARRGQQQRQRMANPATASSRAGAIGAVRPVQNGMAAASSSSGATNKSPPLERVVNSFGPPPAASLTAEVAYLPQGHRGKRNPTTQRPPEPRTSSTKGIRSPSLYRRTPGTSISNW